MSFVIGTSHAAGAGYYRNDDTPSGGRVVQADVHTCIHCQKILLMQQWKDDGGWCGRCGAPICTYCADRMATFGCEPFARQIEAFCESVVKDVAYRKAAGLDQPALPMPSLLPGIQRS